MTTPSLSVVMPSVSSERCVVDNANSDSTYDHKNKVKQC